jgi:hypothetical protein
VLIPALLAAVARFRQFPARASLSRRSHPIPQTPAAALSFASRLWTARGGGIPYPRDTTAARGEPSHRETSGLTASSGRERSSVPASSIPAVIRLMLSRSISVPENSGR